MRHKSGYFSENCFSHFFVKLIPPQAREALRLGYLANVKNVACCFGLGALF